MKPRKLEFKLRQWADQYPVVTVTGPRQSGKTTLCRAVFYKHAYCSLEDIDNRSFAKEDPRGFLAEYSNGVIIDEVQHAPDLVSYIQTNVDEDPCPGRFILTGSRQFEMMECVAQSLAGRTAVARLYPFSLEELNNCRTDMSLDEMLYSGFYPGVHVRNLNPTEAFSFYISTYLERDVRQILSVTDLDRFSLFLRLCATRTGQLLNMQSIGNDSGITHNTVKSWLSVLQASGVIKLLQPWYGNIGKRLVKSPKLYFLDTGLACYLLGILNADHLRSHPLRGNLFETFIVAEAYKQLAHAGLSNQLWFYRDSNSNEVDLLVETGEGFSAYEIKSAATISTDFFKGLKVLQKEIFNLERSSIIYDGTKTQCRNQVNIMPWRSVVGEFDATVSLV
ncbi:MAG: ATP-binding protein [Kiritimatiellae bacterium]|nr:ATP-binding protein [Kiritimatiellia bacterium]